MTPLFQTRQSAASEHKADVLVVGGGHNGLVAAAYLAKSGMSVLVLERRNVAGGAVVTEEVLPGHRIDTGSSCHIMIHGTPVVKDLELERHGLRYIHLDPFAWAPIDARYGGGSIAFYKDVDRTCCFDREGFPSRRRRVPRFLVAFWRDMNGGVMRAFLGPPTPLSLMTSIARGRQDSASHKRPDNAEGIRRVMTSYGQLVHETFTHPGVRGAILWLAAQSGPPPSQTGTGAYAGWQAMLHETGAAHPEGGSGMLSVALVRALESYGGRVVLEAEASKIRIERGRVTGVTTKDGRRFDANVVIAACHVKTTFETLVGESDCPPDLLRRVRNLRVGNGFGMIVRASTTELPRYEGAENDDEATVGMQLLCPDPAYLNQAHADFLSGLPSRDLAVLAMTFSRVDPTIAPAGRHTLYAWSQYFPYELEGGRSWANEREREADRILEVVARWAPNMKGAIVERFIQTPKDLEERFGMLRGNVMHLEMELDQMFTFRPLPELSSYRTPIEGLYLSGASTHPGGGVMGASGHNTAKVVMKDWSRARGLFSFLKAR